MVPVRYRSILGLFIIYNISIWGGVLLTLQFFVFISGKKLSMPCTATEENLLNISFTQ
jgi:hypothetical protein